MSVSSIEAKVRSANAGKLVYEYTLPDTLRAEGIPTKVGLSLLSAGQEEQASKAGQYNLMRAQYESVKRAIATFDGKPVTDVDGEITKFWERCHPKIRALLLSAYIKLTSASQEEENSFFGSETVVA